MHAYYGLSLPRKLWVMGYKGFMGYVGDFPASQLGRWDFLWVMGGYGLREVWVIRVSTVAYGSSSTMLVENLARAIEGDVLEDEEIIITGEHECEQSLLPCWPWRPVPRGLIAR